MTTVPRESILEALETIKEVCDQTGSCSDCPLRVWDSECMLATKQPYAWRVVSDLTPWRAFED